MDETARRRAIQEAYNAEHGIEPRTIIRAVESPLAALVSGDYLEIAADKRKRTISVEDLEITTDEAPKMIAALRKEMRAAAAKLEFERAAELRDRVRAVESWLIDN